ncbi:Error-prone repair homolog of DNA polymerase III alpha subunit (EC [Olavius algarvensis associated proteobacterium Delta 3]|nr:Error-prone repair homolog of DNA polymerase III alpha subunit (EC [Olavius algarvensis associated proteobacterium Delta 3]CAB5172226.1 Error-prone repair homolog of DNA polymerase III alpha subunit (EC [Olavius algarvensis associated proteobacterium Delta 3]
MTPLVVRSHYSLMWGTASVPALCRRARELGYRRLALTDTDNLYGLWPFVNACRRERLEPIVGAEVTDPKGRRRAVCLVKTDAGYRNLCRLLSRRHMEEGFTLEAALPPLSRGLLVLTGNPELLRRWHAAGVSVAAAVPRRPLPPGHRLRRTAATLNISTAAVPGSFFLGPEDVPMHRMLRAIDRNTGLSRLASSDMAPADAWLDSPQGYSRRFAACPETLRATDELAETLSFTGPDFGIVLPPWKTAETVAALREAAYAGARTRYGGELSEAVVERLETELHIISKMGFSAYFLVVRDIVRQSPRICGRGSGAASLVAYCLGITNVCPLKHNLYFGRFLNPGRKDAPDIDVDFAWDERDDVLAAVFDKYRGHAAMVSNHVLFQPRMAIREVAKVYGLTDSEIGRVTRRLPMFWRAAAADTDLHREIAARPEARALEFPDPWPDILESAQRILGTPRYLSVHSGGVVITPEPIDTYVPIQRAPKGVPIIQWEKDATEEAGLVKIDLLGNRSLGVIRDALANLSTNGRAFDESRWEAGRRFFHPGGGGPGPHHGLFLYRKPRHAAASKKSGGREFRAPGHPQQHHPAGRQ